MHVPARLGEQRGHVAAGTLPGATEDFLPALRGFFIERARWRFGRRDSQLIEVQCSQLGGHQVRLIADIVKTRASGNRELRSVAQPWVEEVALAAQIQVSDKRVPVSDRACPWRIGTV